MSIVTILDIVCLCIILYMYKHTYINTCSDGWKKLHLTVWKVLVSIALTFVPGFNILVLGIGLILFVIYYFNDILTLERPTGLIGKIYKLLTKEL